jgi:hypothetical protein
VCSCGLWQVAQYLPMAAPACCGVVAAVNPDADPDARASTATIVGYCKRGILENSLT